MSNPNPTTPTPLPGQWDSAIIRQLAYAALLLIATVAADYFGVARELIEEKGGRLIEAIVSLLAVGVPLFIAYRARLTKPTPPITQEAVNATAARELKIASVPPMMKETAAKSHWVVGVLAVLLALGSFASISGCVGTQQAYKAADSPDKMAYVITEHYTALVTEAANRKEAGTLTGTALEKVQAADRAVAPLVQQLGPLSQAYTATKSAATQSELQDAINKAVLALSNLIDALKGAH